MQKITPFLWFDGQAEEAAKFYCSLFPRSRITEVRRYGEAGPGRKGSVMTVSFQLAGQEFTALNGGPEYQFTPAVSFYISCKTQREIDRLWEKLLRGGQPQQCGWITDRFGLTWQVVPENIGELISSPEAMRAMFGMVKLDIATLKAARPLPLPRHSARARSQRNARAGTRRARPAKRR
jgi:predicted 3-demethylubiquinone-9 3-methyltransferase (glyoxalase superfamily)